jgi:hypothetical protein
VLRAAAEKLAVSSAEEQVAEFVNRKRDAERAKLARTGYEVLRPTLRSLFEMLESEDFDRRPQEGHTDRRSKWERRFGPATLSVEFHNLETAIAPLYVDRAPFEAVAYATIAVDGPRLPRAWSASLWYADLTRTGSYRWYEAAYQWLPQEGLSQPKFPTRLDPSQLSHAAFPPELRHWIVAYEPRPIDDEYAESFCDRWATLISVVAERRIEEPPDRPMGDWWPKYD